LTTRIWLPVKILQLDAAGRIVVSPLQYPSSRKQAARADRVPPNGRVLQPRTPSPQLKYKVPAAVRREELQVSWFTKRHTSDLRLLWQLLSRAQRLECLVELVVYFLDSRSSFRNIQELCLRSSG